MSMETLTSYSAKRPHLQRAARSMHMAGIGIRRICESLGGLKQSTVRSWIGDADNERRTLTGAAQVTEEQMREWAERGLTWRALAEETGLSPYSICTAASVLGIKSGRNISYRVAQVDEILSMRANGSTYSEISAALGVSTNAIGYHCDKYGVERGDPAKHTKRKK